MTLASRPNRGDGATPAMVQWFASKAEHPNALLFFRMGDFYELFFEDAEAASAALDIALTHRGEHASHFVVTMGIGTTAEEATDRINHDQSAIAQLSQRSLKHFDIRQRKAHITITPITITLDRPGQ